jgi:predicted ArsR family transcriptional regulator
MRIARYERDKRDTKKKRFIETLAAQGTVSHAAQAAGVSRMTAYRWREVDREFAARWDEAHENAVDAVESVIYRDRMNIDLKQVHSAIEERLAQLRAHPELLHEEFPHGQSDGSPHAEKWISPRVKA